MSRSESTPHAAHGTGADASSPEARPSPFVLALLADEGPIPETLPAHLSLITVSNERQTAFIIKNLEYDSRSKMALLNAFGCYDYGPLDGMPIAKLQLIVNLINHLGFPLEDMDTAEFQHELDQVVFIEFRSDCNALCIGNSQKKIREFYARIHAELTKIFLAHYKKALGAEQKSHLTLSHHRLSEAIIRLENRAIKYLDLIKICIENEKGMAACGAGVAAPPPTRQRSSAITSPPLAPTSLFFLAPRPTPEELAERIDNANRIRRIQLGAARLEPPTKLSPEERRAQTVEGLAERIESDGKTLTLVNPRMADTVRITNDAYDYMNIFCCLGLQQPFSNEFFLLSYLESMIFLINENHKLNFPLLKSEDFLSAHHKASKEGEDEADPTPLSPDAQEFYDLLRTLKKICPISMKEGVFKIPANSDAIQAFYTLVYDYLKKIYTRAFEPMNIETVLGEKSKNPDAVDKYRSDLTKAYELIIPNLHVFKESALEYHVLIKRLATRLKPKDPAKEERRAALAARMMM